MRRRLSILLVIAVATLVVPAAALAHEAPESQRSRWVMVDWMLETFFIFGGLALAAFIWAWKAGHFHNLEEQARIPLLIHEEDYYTPEWALDEEEWT